MKITNLINIFIIILLLNINIFAKETLTFAPLPTKKAVKNIKDFLPLTSYLDKNLNLNIQYTYEKDYKNILKGFKEGKIDIAYLGPLPYLLLKKEFTYAKAIVTFAQKNGNFNYRCVISKFKGDKINFNKEIKVALTQRFSTCGYYMTSLLLKEKMNIELKDQKYKYTMSHSNALIETLKGNYIIAGAKDTIAKKYESLGMEIIDKSDLLPGFALVVNTKTLSSQTINQIRNELINIPKHIYSKWHNITSYGMKETNNNDYKNIKIDIRKLPKKGNM